jgi:hypothetical protein
MNQSSSLAIVPAFSTLARAGIFLLLISMLALGGCGSTKVYGINKTVVYNGSTYNLSNVQTISSRIEGTLPNGDKVNLKSTDKKAFNSLLDEHQSVRVSSFIELDDKEFVYRNSDVKSYSDFSKIVSRQQSAMNSINKFMAHKKKTQLKLK